MECFVWNTEIVYGGNYILTTVESKKNCFIFAYIIT